MLVILRALGDEIRLRILGAIFVRPRNVSNLVKVLDVSQPDVSHHLRRLREAGLIEGERKGRQIWYGLAKHPSREAKLLLASLREVWGVGSSIEADPGWMSTKHPQERPRKVPRKAPRKAPKKSEIEDYLL